MPASKLTAELKQQVIALYQDTEISIGQLAEQFGVSFSTISRLLQSSLTEQEYQTLVKQKKTKRSAEPPEQSDQINQLDLITP
ncbi:MAG: hypothetical protein SFT94_11590, partial [Pseudanabaenaceae cyanobacterium bins.68]|nr:hypothetical protein [Pseudanabaenaceae cyanobacterium bins.68]